MKNNQPVTNTEVVLGEHDTIVTQTDLKGIITYVNPDFIRISGFSEAELIGKNHNLVRHPDMPVAAFADLWDTLKKGKPWNGLVKNRCKNGDYYWVNAYVSPIEKNGALTGYTSMRTKPSRDQIEAAANLYRSLNAGTANFVLKEGNVVRTGITANLNPLAWLDSLSARAQLLTLIGAFLLGLAALYGLNQAILQKVQVGGPVYTEIDLQKELIANILPPPAYLVESWQVALEMATAPEPELAALADKSRALRQEYESRHKYWLDNLETGELKTKIVDEAWRPGVAFLDLRDRQYIPSLLAGNREAALALLPEMKARYAEHRHKIDEVVKLATIEHNATEVGADNVITQGTRLLSAFAFALALFIAVLGRSVYRNLTRAGDPIYLGGIIRHIAIGNLAISIDTHKESRDSVLHIVKQLQARLGTLIRIVADEANQIAVQSQQMVAASAQVDSSVRVQSESAATVASTTEELTTSIHQVAENAQEALTISNDSSAACEKGVQVIQNAVQSMGQIAETVREAAQTVMSLGAQSDNISSVVHVIQDIADQTNLLALNAAIEAARAGEQGRGFAVVADEVRKLAERTSSATREIETMIGSIQNGLQNAVTNMESGVKQVDNGVSLASEAGESINRIRDGALRVSQVVAEISDALAEQRIASESIAQQIEKIAQGTEENSASAQQTSTGAAMLEKAALQMQNSVSRFVV